MLQSLALVFVGGGIGSLARYSVSLGIRQFPAAVLPWATLISNVTSCLVIAIALVLYGDKLSENMRLFLFVGFCGGFSTFSTFSVETLEIIRRGEIWLAMLNVLINVIFCLVVLTSFVRK